MKITFAFFDTDSLFYISSSFTRFRGVLIIRVTGFESNRVLTIKPLPHPVPATDKVALLIGNLSYQNHPQLKAPMVDVYDLTNLLRQLNFQVVSLLDLTESEMRNAVDEFLLLLHKGVYGTSRSDRFLRYPHVFCLTFDSD